MNTNAVVLRVQGLGNVPAFKNSKLIARGKLITKPEYQTWIKRCIHSFESQLLSAIRTTEEEILTVACPRSLILSSLPEDDSWQWIPEIHIKAVKVPKGQEGATITIERIV